MRLTIAGAGQAENGRLDDLAIDPSITAPITPR
jgi:hypothetical protein